MLFGGSGGTCSMFLGCVSVVIHYCLFMFAYLVGLDEWSVWVEMFSAAVGRIVSCFVGVCCVYSLFIFWGFWSDVDSVSYKYSVSVISAKLEIV